MKTKAAKTPAPAAPAPADHRPPFTLSIDIGGTGFKCSVLDSTGGMTHDKVWRPTPHPCPPEVMLADIAAMVDGLPAFDRVSLGFPGAVRDGLIVTAPHFPDPKWDGFDLASALKDLLGKPARVLNDAEVQGYAVVSGTGLELVLTLGTGAGTALFNEGRLAPHMEFAHHPVHGDKTYNDYVGRDALAKVGEKRWNKRVRRVIGILYNLIHYDRLYIGGGNSAKIEGSLPDDVTLVSNQAGITGGIALWRDSPAA